MNKHLAATIRAAFAAEGSAPAMRVDGRNYGCGGSGRSVHFHCSNLDEVEAYVRRIVAHAPYVVVTDVVNFGFSSREITLAVDPECSGLPGGPVYRAHLAVGMALARRAVDACMDATRESRQSQQRRAAQSAHKPPPPPPGDAIPCVHGALPGGLRVRWLPPLRSGRPSRRRSGRSGRARPKRTSSLRSRRTRRSTRARQAARARSIWSSSAR